MKKYERTIGFKTIFLIFVRRFEFILFTLIPISLILVITTQFVLPTSFYSTSSLKHYDSVIKDNEYKTIVNYVTSSGTVNGAVKELENNNVYHANGSLITVNEISTGLSVNPLSYNSTVVTITFESSDKTIVKEVLNRVTAFTLDGLKKDPLKSLHEFSIAEQANNPVESDKNKKTLIYGLSFGLAVSIFIAFFAELLLDDVYDKGDIETLGASGFEISLPKSRKDK